MDKVFMTTNAQMRLLRSRGLQVSGQFSKQIIEKENYYNLINGYKPLFLDRTYQGQDEKYKAGTDIKEFYSLFIFDTVLLLYFS